MLIRLLYELTVMHTYFTESTCKIFLYGVLFAGDCSLIRLQWRRSVEERWRYLAFKDRLKRALCFIKAMDKKQSKLAAAALLHCCQKTTA